MADLPLVSIALCTYNGEKFLEKQLKTLLQQTYTALEIVVMDDRSSDRTVEILNRYAANDPRLRININERNLGYVKNFEKAIRSCTGAYIALADQDDQWALDKIEIMVAAMQADTILVYHDSEFTDNEDNTLGRMSDVLNMYEGHSPLPFLFYNCISGHSCMFRQTLVPELREFSAKFFHDWWIAYVAGNTGTIRYVNQPLVKYRQHQQSNTDILRRKDKPQDPGIKYAEMNIPWLQNCLRIDGVYNSLIKQLIRLHENKSIQTSFSLMRLLLRHYRELYYIKKKSDFSKLNYIRKMAFYRRRTYYTLDKS